MRRRAGLAVVVAALGLPAGARASTSDVAISARAFLDGRAIEGPVITVFPRLSTAPNNTFVVTAADGLVTIRDEQRGARLVPGDGCTRLGAGEAEVSCRAAGAPAGIVVDGGAAADTITVHGAIRSHLFGDDGNDLLSAGDAPGELHGGDGADALAGGAGDDLLLGEDGDDALKGRAGDDRLLGGANADEIYGDDGFDVADYGDHRRPVTITLDAHAGDGGAEDAPAFAAPAREFVSQSVEEVIGTPGNDALTGSTGPDALLGGAGADVLDGAGGDDRLDGQDGPDTLIGGPGMDAADYSARLSGVTLSLDGVANDGNAADGQADDIRPDVEALVGSRGDDLLTGGPGPDRLSGRAGDDTLRGEGGDDVLDGELGRDGENGGDGDDVLLTVDGLPDFVACGDGEDSGQIDLADAALAPSIKSGASRAGCERLEIAPVREHPGVRIVAVRGHVRVTLACRRRHARCRGGLSLRAGARVVSRTRYRLAPRARAVLVLHGAGDRVVAAERDRRRRPMMVIRRL